VTRARTIAVVTGSRADYGLQYWLIRALRDASDLTLQLVVTGSHLAEAFGRTVEQIRADGLPIAAEVPMIAADDSEWAMARSTGEGVIGMADAFKRLRPDLVVLPGDLTANPAAIRSPTIVFKDGVGYDSAKLIASVQGRVGVN